MKSSGLSLGKEKRGRKILEEWQGTGWVGRKKEMVTPAIHPDTERCPFILYFHKCALLNFRK